MLHALIRNLSVFDDLMNLSTSFFRMVSSKILTKIILSIIQYDNVMKLYALLCIVTCRIKRRIFLIKTPKERQKAVEGLILGLHHGLLDTLHSIK